MPLKTSPKKIKAVTYLTGIEHAQAESLAKLKQLTLSEWLRAVVLTALSSPDMKIVVSTHTDYQPIPRAEVLKNDFIIGDINESDE